MPKQKQDFFSFDKFFKYQTNNKTKIHIEYKAKQIIANIIDASEIINKKAIEKRRMSSIYSEPILLLIIHLLAKYLPSKYFQ